MVKRAIAHIEAIIRSPDSKGLLPAFLEALSMIYGGTVALRTAAYREGMVAARQLPCAVVSIGNLTVGGTGKTPLTIDVARRLACMGLKVAVLSRGYRGRAEAGGAVVSDGHRLRIGPEDAGDEPWMMARHLAGIPVLVGRDRYRSGLVACRRFAAQVVVLDDGFQHLQLKRDLDLITFGGSAPLGNGRLLPRGTLREPVSAVARAHGLIVTGSGSAVSIPTMGKPLFQARRRTVLRTVIGPGQTVPDGRGTGSPFNDPVPGAVKGKRVFGFSGLADNDQFRQSLQSLPIDLVGFAGFDDHHPYRRQDVDQLEKAAIEAGADMVATTEKDLGRLLLPMSLPLAVFGLDIDFADDAHAFDAFLRSRLSDKLKATQRK